MTERTRVVHRSHGRMRIEIPERRGQARYFAELSERLAQVRELRVTRASAAAGSIVLQFEGTAIELARRMEAADPQLAAVVASSATRPPPQEGQGTSLSMLSSPHPMLLAGIALGILGVTQVFRGEIRVPAVSAFWYAGAALHLASKAGACTDDEP